MGFGHRVYKNFDPRSKILKQQVAAVLEELKMEDPLLDIARELEQKTLEDEYLRLKESLSQRRFLFGYSVASHWNTSQYVYGDVCLGQDAWLDRQLAGTS